MTGSEIVGPIVAGAAQIAKNALAEEDSLKKHVSELAKASPATAAAAEARARRILVREAVLLRLLQPLRRFVQFRDDYFETQFARDMAYKLSEIPAEQVVEPTLSIAAQAAEGLSYSLEEPPLKEMYLNLLATASNLEKRQHAHPSFAEIIKQLSSEEALLLPHVFSVAEALPLVRLKRHHPDGSWSKVHAYVTRLPANVGYDALESFCDNWVRLGLIEITFSYTLRDPGEYAWTTTLLQEMAHLVPEELRDLGFTLGVDHGILAPTEFGRRFSKAVGIDTIKLIDITPDTVAADEVLAPVDEADAQSDPVPDSA